MNTDERGLRKVFEVLLSGFICVHPWFLFPFQQNRGALAAANAQRGNAVLCVATAHFVEHCQDQPCAGCADGVAEGDRAAVYVHFLGVDLADGAVAA
jgi:hypothetical protein